MPLAKRHRIDADYTENFRALTGSGIHRWAEGTAGQAADIYELKRREPARGAATFYKVDPEQELIVIYDDISLAPGQLRDT